MASLQCFVMFLLIYKFFGFFILLQCTLMLKAMKSTSRRAEAAGWELARAKCAFGRDSKAGRGMGRLYREKGEEFYHVPSERCRHKDSLEAGQLLPQVWISLIDRELRVKQAWEMGRGAGHLNVCDDVGILDWVLQRWGLASRAVQGRGCGSEFYCHIWSGHGPFVYIASY